MALTYGSEATVSEALKDLGALLVAAVVSALVEWLRRVRVGHGRAAEHGKHEADAPREDER